MTVDPDSISDPPASSSADDQSADTGRTVARLSAWIRNKWNKRFFWFVLVPCLVAYACLYFGNWPSVVRTQPEACDVIIVLGGGFDRNRAEIAKQAIDQTESDYIIVTGDGGRITDELLKSFPTRTIRHEPDADSTWENAQLTLPMVKHNGGSHVMLVTNWFHGHRAKRTFESVYGDSFRISVYSDAPQQLSKYDLHSQRRERFAIAFYALRHGVFPW